MNIEHRTSNIEWWMRTRMAKQKYDLEERLLVYSVRIIKIVERLSGNRRIDQDFRCGYQTGWKEKEIAVESSVLGVCFFIRCSMLDVHLFIRCSTFNLFTVPTRRSFIREGSRLRQSWRVSLWTSRVLIIFAAAWVPIDVPRGGIIDEDQIHDARKRKGGIWKASCRVWSDSPDLLPDVPCLLRHRGVCEGSKDPKGGPHAGTPHGVFVPTGQGFYRMGIFSGSPRLSIPSKGVS